eukprot:TRINITY_DN3625_c0_g2_i2.p1 TRINITY_DN3625_c0_g2~~TRINITY_DN3625_c0_g2_i2.p1  ORF type:complete len:355 (+),score=76.68 TRINITY_DN3625_c0_g2_i2:649-1713(+)
MKLKTRGTIPISWMYVKQTRIQDQLVHKQIKDAEGEPVVCSYRVRLVGSEKIYIISAESDSLMQEWIDSILPVLKHFMTKEEMAEKVECVKKLEPHFKNQAKAQMEQYAFIVQTLQSSVFFTGKSTKLKEGYLYLRKLSKRWQKYYFVLMKDCLSYFNLEDKLIPRAVISLSSIQALRYSSDGGEDKTQFLICTPLRSYQVRAKHSTACADWISRMSQAAPALSSSVVVSPDPIPKSQPIQSGDKICLHYSVNGKQKEFKMKKSSLLIGRSSKADLQLDRDMKVSRDHARIEIGEDGIPVFSDLGSMAGSKVNGNTVTSISLSSRDLITIGTTIIEFVIKDSRNKVREKQGDNK